jgi:3-dehydroquinate synthase
MIMTVDLGNRSYDIITERGSLHRAAEYLDLDRKVMVVTDDGVPEEYAEAVRAAAKDGHTVTVAQGEASKCFEQYQHILSEMLSLGFGRGDCVVAVGGGVCGDLAGFAAATYMRGVDFYNVPTTVLSMVDSSVGGKTAIDFRGVKNVIGAFKQPKRVLIDADVLKTLPKRQISNGFAEAVKMALTFDEELFSVFETEDPMSYVDKIITHSLLIKKAVVEADETEKGLRRVLNFGHTIGHGIELATNEEKLYHGECVSIGMVAMSSDEVRKELIPILDRLNLPTSCDVDGEEVYRMMCHDKKASGAMVSAVFCDKVGEYRLQDVTLVSLMDRIRSVTD